MLFERAHNVQESFPIVGIIGAIARKVNIYTPAAQLCAEVAKCKKLIGAQQHVDRPGTIGNRLNHVQLVGKPPPGSHSCEVLSLIQQ